MNKKFDPSLFLTMEERVAFHIAEDIYPGLDVRPYLEEIDRLADELRPRLEKVRGPIRRAKYLIEFLFKTSGFMWSGNSHDPQLCCLNNVLDERVGNDVTLGILLVAIGKRVSIQDIEPVVFPSGFLVRINRKYFSPLDANGNAIKKKTLIEAATPMVGSRGLAEMSLIPADDTEIAICLLSQLHLIFLKLEDIGRVFVTSHRLYQRTNDSSFLLQRGLCAKELGLKRSAKHDFERVIGQRGTDLTKTKAEEMLAELDGIRLPPPN